MTDKQRAALLKSMWADLRKTEHGYEQGGPTRQLNVYAFVRQLLGNGSFDIGWADTFMEIYRLGPAVFAT